MVFGTLQSREAFNRDPGGCCHLAGTSSLTPVPLGVSVNYLLLAMQGVGRCLKFYSKGKMGSCYFFMQNQDDLIVAVVKICAYNPRSWKAEFEVVLGYIARLSLK